MRLIVQGLGLAALVLLLGSSSASAQSEKVDPFDCTKNRDAVCLSLATEAGHFHNLFWKVCNLQQSVTCGCHNKLAEKQWMGGYGLPEVGHICPWAKCFCADLPDGSDKDAMCGMQHACEHQRTTAEASQ